MQVNYCDTALCQFISGEEPSTADGFRRRSQSRNEQVLQLSAITGEATASQAAVPAETSKHTSHVAIVVL